MWVGFRVRLPGSPATHGLPLNTMNQFPNVVMKQINDTGAQRCSFNMYLNNRDVYGITKVQYQDGFYASGITGNPNAPAIIIEPFGYSTVALGDFAYVRCSFKLTYYVKFYDPVIVSVS